MCRRAYDLKDIYLDAHKQLKDLQVAGQLSADDFQMITAKTKADDLKTLAYSVRKSSPHSKGAQDIIPRLVVSLKRFENAIDMIVQSSPPIMGLNLVGLIWGGLKFILVVSRRVGRMIFTLTLKFTQIAGDMVDTLNMVVDLLDEVLKGLPVLEAYVEMFGASTSQLLRAPLTNLYAELIAFVVMAVKLFDRSETREWRDFLCSMRTLTSSSKGSFFDRWDWLCRTTSSRYL